MDTPAPDDMPAPDIHPGDRVPNPNLITSKTRLNDRAKREAERVRILREQLATAMPDIIKKLVTQSLAGDVSASRVLVERAIPAPKPVEQPLRLKLDPSKDTAEALFQAVIDGQIGPEAGGRLLQAVASIAEARVAQEFSARITALEAKAQVMDAGRVVADTPMLRIPARADASKNGSH